MTWQEFDSEWAMSMEQFSARSSRLLELAGGVAEPDIRRAFGREMRFWDRFVTALRWAVAEYQADYAAEDGTWKFLELDEILPYQHARRQLRLAEVYQEWGHMRIRRLYGASV